MQAAVPAVFFTRERVHMEKLKTSVILASYNGEKYIAEQLDSIAGQSLLPDEILIGDDGSSDQTAELIEKWIGEHPEMHAVLYRNAQTLGHKANFYSLMEKASGDLVFLCDQDDVWYRNKAERMVSEFERFPETGALSASYDVIGPNGKIIRKGSRSGKRKKISHAAFLGYPAFPGMAMAFRKDIGLKTLHHFGPAEPGSKPKAMHDWAVNYTASKGGSMFFLDVPLTGYRRHENNASGMMCYEQREQKAEKRIRLVEELICNMKAAGDDELKKLISFEEKRLEMLKKGQIIPLFFFELFHLNRTGVRAVAGDIYSLLSRVL